MLAFALHLQGREELPEIMEEFQQEMLDEMGTIMLAHQSETPDAQTRAR